MPGAQERVLRRRIGSVQNTKKITRAMELIAATRVVKAQSRANEARPYAERITQVIQDLAAAGAEVDHPLLRPPETVSKIGVVVLAGDRGLAGAYNSNVIKTAEREVQAARAEGKDFALVTVGRKAEGYFRFRSFPIEAAYSGFTDRPNYEDAVAIAARVTDLFVNGGCDRIVLVYTRFISLGSQEVVVRRFLPLESTATIAAAGDASATAGFDFEPSAADVLETLLPRYVESRMFAALLDAAASELASRQRAMKSATDNAQDLILKLTRKMNQVRQDAITTEIMEIISGAEALAEDRGSPEDLLLDHLDSDPFPTAPGSQAPPPDPPRQRPLTLPHDPHQETSMTVTEPQLVDGRIVAIAGPVVDVEFPPTALPEINTALQFDIDVGGESIMVTAEVAQQIGDSRVRAIAMKPTDGLVRGATVRNTGTGITVPVGDATLGHVFNVLGEPLDVESVEVEDRWAIHRAAPNFDTLEPKAHDVPDRHQGDRPAHPVPPGRQDRSVRRCRRRQDRAHHRDDQPRRQPVRWRVGVRRRRRAHP